ncbi:hypothetical protein NESM_000511700 [Novymonas esmeraldas]|uniref:Uncharacterized protein n=1 Tax=Novymonas esmeraldas TaxID=1808958 RepID=A0AAW0ERI6_9TRYP
MLNRVIQDIYHLRRVHAVLPDAVLGDTLKNKLLRLSLQPSLQQLKQCTYASAADAPGVLSASADARGRVASPYAIDPWNLTHLLDSLAYFHLGSSAVAAEAVQLVQLSAPSMSVSQLCTTLAACCALGAQTDITATALPLLRAALTTYTAVGASFGTATPRSTGAALLFSQGATILPLLEALQQARVKEVQVWHLLAEHCLRYLDSFDGRQLCAVIAVLRDEGVDDYPDFFVAAERHIAVQPAGYLTPDQLGRIVSCYKELRQPVVSLLALVHATPLHGEDVERSISAAAAVVALSSGGAGGGASVDGRAPAGQAAATRHPSLEVFEGAAVKALTTADAHGVLDLLQKCEQRRVMTPAAMDAALRRLLVLYYPDRLGRAAGTASGAAAAASASRERRSAHTPLQLHQLSQSLLVAFSFNDATLYAQQLPVVVGSSSSAGGGGGESAVIPAVATALLDALAEELQQWYHHRVLRLVPCAARLLPAAAQPHTFYHGIVKHLRRSNDLSSHEGPQQLHMLIEALLTLRAYGGEAILVQYMPAITVAVLNTPRSTQLELTAMLAHLPSAREELIVGVYRQWGAQKRWLQSITEEEVGWVLQIMSRSGGLRDSQLLHAILEYVRARRSHLPPKRLVEYLHQLAGLGVRDLEFFTQVAEELMRRAMASAPPAETTTTTAAAARDGSGSGSGRRASTVMRYHQWQLTTVHDLCLLLFVFTFVLDDSIRVTQQIVARLKVCASLASPRDVSLVLYAFVKLRITRSDDITGQLCERACATLSEFRATELASVWGSLRCLRHPHAALRQRTLDALASSASATHPTLRFADHDCISLAAALLLTTAPSSLASVRRRLSRPQPGGDAVDGDATASAAADDFGVSEPASCLAPAFEQHLIGVCLRLLPSATGQRLYLILCSLSRCDTPLQLSAGTWQTMLRVVDTHAESLSTGVVEEETGLAALEVLVALRQLMFCVSDIVALTEFEMSYDAAAPPTAGPTMGRASAAATPARWLTPYCPPGLWAVLRPHWAELQHSVDRAHLPTLDEVAADIGSGDDRAGVATADGGRKTKKKKTRAPSRRRQ